MSELWPAKKRRVGLQCAEIGFAGSVWAEVIRALRFGCSETFDSFELLPALNCALNR